MDLGLKHKSVLVAAGSQGLGKECARAFAREGAFVTIMSRNEENLRQAAEEIEQDTGRKVAYKKADVREAKDIDAAVAYAAEQGDGLDVLVTNAGGPPAGGFANLTDEMWYQAFELNLMSVVRLVRAAVPHMKARGMGRIATITSSSIRQPVDNLTLSNTLRAGVHGLTKSLSLELASDNILVNTIGPGRIGTQRIEQLDKYASEVMGVPEETIRNRALGQIPLGRYGLPAEFAQAVVFLCSFKQAYITGQTLLVDGGMVKAL